MKQIALLSILILIFVTSLIKTSTKEIEDKIFTSNENIKSQKAEFSDLMLEFNYLTSPEKLIQYQSQYFENNLIKIDITEIKIINFAGDNFEIFDFLKKKINE